MPFRFIFCIAISAAYAVAIMPMVRANDAASTNVSREPDRFFENEVRPLLVARCVDCHAVDDASGDLALDSRSGILSGGESGPAVLPGKPDDSLLMQAVRYESHEMPPSEPLSQAEIDTFERWIRMGAPWPESDPHIPIRKRADFDEDDRSWWAIQALVRPPVPPLDSEWSSWPRNAIDHFVLRRMREQELTPAPEADRTSLIRRLSLGVTGLPPTPSQIDAFVDDPSPDAYERLVDRLLASKRYGEHAARWWLDLVRYADSDGYRADGYRPDAWRYRDYVIESLNADKPYDRFVQEQLAGDEMFPGDADALVATGYLRHWVYEWNIRDARTQWKTILEDLTDTTADVFMGLGLQCAKCHNHKFDPLLQKDYFRLQAFFAPILPVDRIVADSSSVTEHQRQLRRWESETRSIRDAIAEIEQPYREKARNLAIDRFPDDLRAIARKPVDASTPHEIQLAYLIERQVQAEYDRLDKSLTATDKEKLVKLRHELKKFDPLKPKPLPTAMTVTDVGPVAPPTNIPRRPSVDIEPGIPSILDAAALPIDAHASTDHTMRRTALAKWLTRAGNPLTTRVIANRLWKFHFGRGLAAHASDFGRLGGTPSHPELLDYLATQLVSDGWSLKSLHKMILMSAAYRQSTTHPRFDEYQMVDPSNQLVWRGYTRRLTAEQIRDSLLMVSGKLNDRDGGPGQVADAPCRTIYTRVMRNSPDALLGSFDLPQFFSSNASRNTTTTPLQSLLLMNSDPMLGHARGLANRVRDQASRRSVEVVDAWRRVYGRRPEPAELEQSLQFMAAQERDRESQNDAEPAIMIETSKLAYRDGQAVSFNLDDDNLNLSVPHHPDLNLDDFTIETFFELRSIANTGAVRTLAAKWNGSRSGGGWRLGVTGAGSRRKPQTMVLQMIGQRHDGTRGEAAIFSDQHVKINTPYFVAASFRLPRSGNEAQDESAGEVTFYLKDLSNDDEPLSVVTVPHGIVGGLQNQVPFTIGRRSGTDGQSFDGLVDDVRLSGIALDESDLLITVERELPETIGFWTFEVDPGVRRNAVADTMHLTVRGDALIRMDARQSALADFCHALLNSNGFLYTH